MLLQHAITRSNGEMLDLAGAVLLWYIFPLATCE